MGAVGAAWRPVERIVCSCVVSNWNAGAAILLGFGERDDRRATIQDAVVVAVDSSFPTPHRRMQTAPR